jgi:hypothetical protein
MLIRQIVNVIVRKNRAVEKILAPEAARRFDGIVLGWFLLSYGLGSLVVANDISFSECDRCNSIVLYLPSIHRLAVGSRYSEAMHFVWLYALLTAPFLLALLFSLANEFHHRTLPIWGVVFFASMGLFGSYTCFVGMDFGGEDALGKFGQLYHNYLLYSSFVACASAGTVAVSVFYLTHHFVGYVKNETGQSGR